LDVFGVERITYYSTWHASRSRKPASLVLARLRERGDSVGGLQMAAVAVAVEGLAPMLPDNIRTRKGWRDKDHAT
jgi:hypothetical protein